MSAETNHSPAGSPDRLDEIADGNIVVEDHLHLTGDDLRVRRVLVVGLAELQEVPARA